MTVNLYLVRRKKRWLEQMENWRMNRSSLPSILKLLSFALPIYVLCQDKFFWNMVEHHFIHILRWSSIVGDIFAITTSNRISIGAHLVSRCHLSCFSFYTRFILFISFFWRACINIMESFIHLILSFKWKSKMKKRNNPQSFHWGWGKMKRKTWKKRSNETWYRTAHRHNPFAIESLALRAEGRKKPLLKWNVSRKVQLNTSWNCFNGRKTYEWVQKAIFLFFDCSLSPFPHLLSTEPKMNWKGNMIFWMGVQIAKRQSNILFNGTFHIYTFD